MTYLQQKRKALGLSVAVVAEKLGVTQQFYYRVENEKVGLPLRRVKSLIKILGLKQHQYVHIQKTLLNFYAAKLDKYFPQ